MDMVDELDCFGEQIHRGPDGLPERYLGLEDRVHHLTIDGLRPYPESSADNPDLIAEQQRAMCCLGAIGLLSEGAEVSIIPRTAKQPQLPADDAGSSPQEEADIVTNLRDGLKIAGVDVSDSGNGIDIEL